MSQKHKGCCFMQGAWGTPPQGGEGCVGEVWQSGKCAKALAGHASGIFEAG
jgi:hypothetical protein